MAAARAQVPEQAHALHASVAAAENTFDFEASYVADAYANLRGGLQTGGDYMGMANLRMGFDTEKAGWWRGGRAFVNGASIHGRSLSQRLAGDLQVASNIDAGEHVYLHELWYAQQLGCVELRAGLQDANVQYMNSENACQFLNSSFGVPPVLSGGQPMPIFPLTGLGFSAAWSTGKWTVQAAVFDGCPLPFEQNPHNLRWSLDRKSGVLAMGEVHARLGGGGYKLGTYYHSQQRNYGFYALIDQPVWRAGARHLDLFGQLALSPSAEQHAYYGGLGANLFGVFAPERDAVGLAVAALDLRRAVHRGETAVEFYYRYTFADGHFCFQPDVQYIINPAGTTEHLKNALLAILRMTVTF